MNEEFVDVGYFPKRTSIPKGWKVPPHADEICSVSECAAVGPEGWVDLWLHNSFGFFDTPELARQVGPAPEFTLFAYRLLRARFSHGLREPLTFSAPGARTPAAFDSLGFDVVSKSATDSISFECSPLSCNGLAAKIPVNRCCLLESFTAAEAAAVRCCLEEPEPGPYYLLEVLRERA